MACPDEVAVDAVLSRTAAPRIDAHVRAHVATCEACLERWGACFELELWGGVMDEVPRASEAPQQPRLLRTRRRRIARVAAAAVLIGGALLGWRFARRSAPSVAEGAINQIERTGSIDVVELTMEYGVSGPNGSRRVKKTLLPGSPARLLVVETKVGVDGVVMRHERTDLLSAVAKEKGP
jgi:hypothetical protein